MVRITRTRDGVITTEDVGESLSEFKKRKTRERLQTRGITSEESESKRFKEKFGVIKISEGGFGLSEGLNSDDSFKEIKPKKEEIDFSKFGPRIDKLPRGARTTTKRVGPRIDKLPRGARTTTKRVGPRIDNLPKTITSTEKAIAKAKAISSTITLKEISALEKKIAKLKTKRTGNKIRVKRLENELEDLRKGKGSTTFLRKQSIEALIGIGIGVKGAKDVVRHPIETGKSVISTVRHPIETGRALKEQFKLNPTRTIAEFWSFNKITGVAGRGIKKNPIVRTIAEENFIRKQPKNVRNEVRAILKSNRIQEKIIPINPNDIKSVSFTDVANLNKAQARALLKTQKEVGAVLFGSKASSIISKGKTKIPKDIDIAVKDVNKFNKAFLKNLPKSERGKLKIKNQKIVNKKTGETIADVKPLSRLTPDKNILTGKGQLPIAGFKTKIEFDISKGSFLPKLKKGLSEGILEVPTQKIIEVGGIKIISFGEQTTRKGLGTLQVLLEKNTKRAKDPSAFIESLKIQSKAIKKKGGFLNKRKAKLLDDNIKILEAKFIKKKPKNIKSSKKKPSKIPKLKSKPQKKKFKITKVKPKNIKSSKKKPQKLSIIPSKIPKRKAPSRLPSKIPKKKPSKIPKSKIPKSKIPKSKIPKSKIPKLPFSKISKLPKSRISKLPKSRISKLPFSKISKLPKSKIPKKKPSKIPKLKSKPQKKKFKITKVKPKKVKFFFTPTLAGEVKKKKKKGLKQVIYSGIEIRE